MYRKFTQRAILLRQNVKTSYGLALLRIPCYIFGRRHALIDIFTDGGCSGNPGPGGWAFVAIQGENQHRASGAEAHTTNNKMELTAVIRALEWLLSAQRAPGEKARVCTDSQYVQQGITKWIFSWEKNGWKTSDKKPVKNQDLWQKLGKLSARAQPQWVWVKGHAGNPHNEACDAMVQAEIKKLKRE
jgi:ribonuclease HI